MMKLAAALLLGFPVALAGCTTAVHFDATPMVDVRNKIDLDVGVFVDKSQMNQVYSESGLYLLGLLNTWNVQTGAGSAATAWKTFSLMFRSVEMLKVAGDFESRSLTLLITPTIEHFAISQDLTADLLLKCVIVDRFGETVYKNTVAASGGSQMMTACCLGALGGQSVLGKTSGDAFSDAYTQLANDIMKRVDFSRYL
jgi:hypothetical protein